MSKKTARIFVFAALTALLVSVSAYATKKLWSASMSSDFELGDVVGANAIGSSLIVTKRDGSGYEFRVKVGGLSGAPMGVHLHGPATAAENAPVLITLCGSPSPAASSTCTYDPVLHVLDISGDIQPGLLQLPPGATPGDFDRWLSGGVMYINVHTELNPAGECRGQFRQIYP